MTSVARIGDGIYRVEEDGRSHLVYVAGRAGDFWAFWNGRVFRVQEHATTQPEALVTGGRQRVSAPMPARVLSVPVAAGARVRQGDTLVILEAMKMELPLRSAADGTVTAVRCRAGDLVQPDTVLVELQ